MSVNFTFQFFYFINFNFFQRLPHQQLFSYSSFFWFAPIAHDNPATAGSDSPSWRTGGLRIIRGLRNLLFPHLQLAKQEMPKMS